MGMLSPEAVLEDCQRANEQRRGLVKAVRSLEQRRKVD